MKIENVAFLIPIHPNHYHFIYDLINKLKFNDIDISICLVFSNCTDYDAFIMKNEIVPIVISSPFQPNSIVTYKKFYGLKHLANSKFDYIICCDSEIDIMCSNFTTENVNHKIKCIFDNKKIYAGETQIEPIINITQTSANLFMDKYEYLKNITKNFTLYFWWSDLPVYRTTDLNPFFNAINYDNIGRSHFDYIIYQYYLILCHDFEIVNITPMTNCAFSFEELNTNDIDILNKLINIGYGFSWNNKRFYNLNKQFVESQQGFLIYHLDRWP